MQRGTPGLVTVLSLHNITLTVGREPRAQTLLHNISAHVPAGHFVGIVGPAGSGKSTLLKVIAGVYVPTRGAVHWQERDLAEEDLAPGDIGYVPQFSIAYDHLTIWESMDAALRLRLSGLTAADRRSRALSILEQVGLAGIATRMVRVLSGGEKRRLGLALELVSQPALLLADEVTSGLDPKAEEEVVRLLWNQSRQAHRIVVSVTHNLRHLCLCDSVLVLTEGRLAYHGSPQPMLQYFACPTPEDVFPKLATRAPSEWALAWLQQEKHYAPAPTVPPPVTAPREHRLPGAFRQFTVLLERRWRIFFRDRSHVGLHLALLLGFPCLVVIFALEGLPQIRNLSMSGDINILQQLRESLDYLVQATTIGRLVSGLVMLQVVLLTLMASNNAAREIAAERLIVEKEKLAGVRPGSFLASKASFLAVLVTAQSLWMAVFVNWICRLPGDFADQLLFLLLVNGAMTAVCLAISSWMRSPEQASLVSVYLVGFQLPLSGAVLGLPEWLRWLTQPFIAAYWSWSGILQTMRDTRFYDVVQLVTPTPLAPVALCLWSLGSHVALGLFIAYLGCRQSRWE
jgi:ABC-type multidrug transport system ATPase subunit